MHSRALHILTTTATTVAAATLLTSCGLPGFSDDVEPTDIAHAGAESHDPIEPSDTADADHPQYDTGSYKTQPAQGWNETSDQDGPTVEMARIADNTLLPYEVDAALKTATRVEYYDTPGKFAFDLNEGPITALRELGSAFRIGYGVFAEADDGRNASNIVIRFEDPEAAKVASDAIEKSFLTEGRSAPDEAGNSQPDQPVDIPGHPDAHATLSSDGRTLSMLEIHNEYLMLVTAESDAETLDEGWQASYVAGFVDRQKPLLDTIPTKKTPAGYGFSNEWPPVDPDDILRFTLAHPTGEDEAETFSFTGAMNKRQMAGNYSDAPKMLNAIDQANVEAMAQNQTRLFRTKNRESAELIAATMKAARADGEVEFWDHPEGVPGVTCSTEFVDDMRTSYSCGLVYENYFATATIEETDFSAPGETRVGDSEQTTQTDPKKQLAQAMAAQYLILTQAPTK